MKDRSNKERKNEGNPQKRKQNTNQTSQHLIYRPESDQTQRRKATHRVLHNLDDSHPGWVTD